RREAFLGHDFGGRVDDPFALTARDDLAGQVVTPAGQPHLGAPRALGGEASLRVRLVPGAGRGRVEPGRELGRIGVCPGDEFVGDFAQVVRGAVVQPGDGDL